MSEIRKLIFNWALLSRGLNQLQGNAHQKAIVSENMHLFTNNISANLIKIG